MRTLFAAAALSAAVLLSACAALQNNGLYMRATATAGKTFCGKDYDPGSIDDRRLCLGMVLVAAAEAGVDRVTHGQTEDAPYMSGFVAGVAGVVDGLSKAGPVEIFTNADDFNAQRLVAAAGVRALHREISFIQLATAGLTTGVAAATGGGVTVAAAAAGGGWVIPDFIGGPAVRSADFAGKVLAVQADAAALLTAIKAGTIKPADAWTEIKARIAADEDRVDALTRAQ